MGKPSKIFEKKNHLCEKCEESQGPEGGKMDHWGLSLTAFM
jgi:hypothetical protein